MRPIDGDRLMMHLTDWWYSSFGQSETDESKAIKTVIDKIEQTLGVFAMEKQEQDWIPVTERLPENKKKVLVSYDTEDGKKVDISMFDKYGCLLGHVSAWRPLPEPYTEEDNDQ